MLKPPGIGKGKYAAGKASPFCTVLDEILELEQKIVILPGIDDLDLASGLALL
jgi:hypothetical protein